LLGKYHCFVCFDWEKGLPLLLKGDDAVLKDLATKSLAAPNDAAALVEVGDAWWNAAEAARGKSKGEFQCGAQHWYTQVASVLTGLTRAKVDQRLKELDSVKLEVAVAKKAPAKSPPPKPAPAPAGPQEGSFNSDPDRKQLPLNARLATHINVSQKGNQTVDTKQLGSGETPFRLFVPEGGLVIGLDIVYFGSGGAKLYVGAFRGVMLTAKGKVVGPWHGVPGNRDFLHIEAKPGYAVGGLRIKAGGGIDSLIVIFMKINGLQLDPSDSYTSDFYGGQGGNGPTDLGMDGSLVVGLFGKNTVNPDSTANGLGLITIPPK
jgi:hypothetical protein